MILTLTLIGSFLSVFAPALGVLVWALTRFSG
jgi:hypothetical protein